MHDQWNLFLQSYAQDTEHTLAASHVQGEPYLQGAGGWKFVDEGATGSEW